MAFHLVGIGLQSGGVKEDDRSTADHLHHTGGADERGGVLVDPHAEQRR